MRRFTGVAILGAGILGLVGCNALLHNEPWTLATDAGSDATSGDGGVDARDSAPADTGTPDAAECPDGGARCNGLCTDRSSDPRNCAVCGHDCSALLNVVGPGATCNQGTCQVPASACRNGYAHCSSNPEDGCETNVTGAGACGSCTRVCPAAAPACQEVTPGVYDCVTGCSGTKPTLCGTSCVNTTNDPNHCGSCPKQCPSPPTGGSATCVSNSCGVACNGQYHQCGTSAVCARDDDAANCGASCVSCPVPPSNGIALCASNACAVQCGTGFHQCGTTAVCASDNDATHCGPNCTNCPKPTNGSAVCDAVTGTCDITCTAPFTKCNGACVNLGSDPNNCGHCGPPTCAVNQICNSATCCYPLAAIGCATAGQCCSTGARCQGGQCCLPTGAMCTASADCCSAMCTGVCS